MATVIPGRMTADIHGDFVVFLIGMRVNRWWKVNKWWPVAMAMPRMMAELKAHPELGCLHIESYFGVSVQYWRSFEQLEAFARSTDHTHWPAWVAFNKHVRASTGDVGIWHETYIVRAGLYETLYGAMPRVGLAAAGRHIPVTAARNDARERLAHPTAQEATS